MKHPFSPVLKQSLSDTLSCRIRGMIRDGDFQRGDRLPSIMEMARQFGVGHPTIREALKKLEATGFLEIRHGSGVYVARCDEAFVVASPDYSCAVTRKLLLDLVQARTPLETTSVAAAVHSATNADIAELRRLLARAMQHQDDDDVLNDVNVAFHHQIARASGNEVVLQLLDVVCSLFTKEQRLISGIYGSREWEHKEHLGILEAIELRDELLAVERMHQHLQGIQDTICRWSPDDYPLDAAAATRAAGRSLDGHYPVA